MKEKKVKLEKINSEFQAEIRNGAEKLFDYMTDFIESQVDKAKFQEVVAIEKNCDRLKEQYIELLFKNKRALPFLVEDRYKIVRSLDKILNKSEFIARLMQVFPFELFDDIKSDIQELNILYLEAINQLLNCTMLMETDFEAAYSLTFEVEKLRRKAHDLKFKILDVLFNKHKDEPLRVDLTWHLIRLFYDGISWTEEISDYLRSLIIKYPSR